MLLDARTEVAFNSGVRTPAASRVWTDVSAYVELDRGIQIQRGRPDQLATSVPATCNLVLDNRDGRFTPGLASGAYYPNVRLGRPIRVLVNILTAGDFGRFEADINGFGASNATLARSTAQAFEGAASLQLTATATSFMSASTNAGTSGFPVFGGETFLASARFRAATTGRAIALNVQFYDAGGSSLGSIPAASGADVTGSWTQLVGEVTAPGTAAFARFIGVVTAPAIGEVHRIDEARIESIRFCGFVDEWEPDWPDGTDTYAVTNVAASGRIARLGEGSELRSVIETEIMADGPIRYYPMGESGEFGHCLDITGNDDIGMYSFYGGDGIILAGAKGPSTDGLAAPQITPFLTGEPADALAAHFRDTAMTECTIECFVGLPSRNENDVVSVIALYESFHGEDFRVLQISGVSVDTISGPVSSIMAEYSEQVAGVFSQLGSTTIYADPATALDEMSGMFQSRIHHVALTFDPGVSPVLKTYFDGELFNTRTGTLGTLMTSMPTFSLLLLGPYSTDSGERPMTVAHAAVFDTILPDDRIKAHADAGLNGFAGELAADRLERYAAYAGVEASEVVSDPGLVPLSHIDTTNKTPESLLRIVETTENGVLYDRRDGKLGFRDRAHRYQVASAFTINVSDQELEGDGLKPVLDRTSLVNEATSKSATDSTVEQRYADDTFADETGGARVDLEIASTDLDQLYQSAAWRVNKFKEPVLRVKSLKPVDILPLDGAKAAAIAAADVSTRFTLAGQPAQLGTTGDYFVEGVTETLGVESWRFEFNVSPTTPYDAIWVLDSGTKSQLGTTTIPAL